MELSPQGTPEAAVDPELAPDDHPRAPIGESVYEELLGRVLSSELGPDDRITIDALARELRVSQTPIREALHRLSADGIVVRNHLSGYRVAPKMTRAQFEDLIVIRQLLEPAAARRAAEEITPEQLASLDQLEQQMASVLGDRGRSYAEFSRLDAEFHDQIAVAGVNTFIREALSRLHTHAHLFRLSNHALITSLAVDEHARILTAIRLRDPGDAAFAMRQHIDASAVRFRKSFDD
ncbi:GntR family transcriptional regulator [Amnibacterium flavum]|nr:GntR family transcriptional regulator [Amnibacterium flavum]